MKFVCLLVLYINCVYCQDAVGDSCKHEGAPGVCRPLLECLHAQKSLLNRKKITDCFFDDDDVRVVCCVEPAVKITNEPTSDPAVKSRIEPDVVLTNRSSIETPNYVVLKFEDKECRFNGTLPISCCNDLDFTDLTIEEPDKCPKPPEPKLQNDPTLLPYEKVIFDACYKYSWIGSKCLANNLLPGRYVRDQCSGMMTTPKVAGGDPAMPREFPHMAVLGSLKKDKSQEYIWYAGGSLISDYFILTASHATYHSDHGKLQFALLGTVDKSNIRSGILYDIQQILRYPYYNATTKRNDIALLKLDRRVVFSEFIRPACLRVPGLQVITERIIAGWGYTEDKKETNVLLKAIIYELPASECERHLTGRYFEWDSSSMLCGGPGELPRNPDSCEGDSGGPLMTHLKELPCSYVVVGIVSWGPRCGVGYPGCYTNASKPEYLQWIVGHVWPRQLKKQLSLQPTAS